MPRPTRMRFLLAPGLSERSLSFTICPPSLLADNFDEMRHLGDQAAHGRRILESPAPPDSGQAQADEGLALPIGTSGGAPGLLDGDGLGRRHLDASPHASTASASVPWRRDCKVETLSVRRAATARGESSRPSASKVARIIL